jgi:hypothetical protein
LTRWKEPKTRAKELFHNAAVDRFVRQRRILPPPTVFLHCLGSRNEAIGNLIEVPFIEVVTKDESTSADPTHRDAFGSKVILKHPVVAAWLRVQGCPHRGHVGDSNG